MEAILIAVVFGLLIRIFIIQPIRVISSSMENTLLIGDCLLINKLVYQVRIPFLRFRLPPMGTPKPGEIIVFSFPDNPSQSFIKRCVAIGGQLIEVRSGVLYVDGKIVSSPPFAKRSNWAYSHSNIKDKYGPLQIPEDHFFAMGDNRDHSKDSRSWGAIPHSYLEGKVMLVYFSWRLDSEVLYSRDLSTPRIFLYNIIHFSKRVRWNRIGKIVR